MANVCCASRDGATLCALIRGGSVFRSPGWLMYAVLVKLVSTDVSNLVYTLSLSFQLADSTGGQEGL